MGNSFCCISIEKGQNLPIQSEILVDINKKEIKNNNNSNLNFKNEFYIKKTTSARSPKSEEDNDFINPLPEIVIIKRKKL